MLWTWSDREDSEILENGVTVFYVDGSKEIIQDFVEKASYRIGYKVDFSYMGVIAHIDTFLEGAKLLKELIKNKNFMKNFLCDYDTNPEKYFMIHNI